LAIISISPCSAGITLGKAVCKEEALASGKKKKIGKLILARKKIRIK
jgi:hypothetical protein